MLLRLLRGSSWWPGRGHGAIGRADRGAAVGNRPASSATGGGRPGGNGTAAHGVELNGANGGGAGGIGVVGVGVGGNRAGRPGVPPGSHRKVRNSRAVSGPGNGVGTDRPEAARPPGAAGTAASAGAARSASQGAARAAIREAPQTGAAPVAGIASPARSAAAAARQPANASNGQPWYATTRSSRVDLGLRDCGCLERVLIREWDGNALPAPETVAAINRLAGLPQLIKEKLAVGLEAIHVGTGGVPDLDQMGGLKGVALPSGRATWDACAGAYGDRKIIVGSRMSPTPDVMCHEVGHALDDLDGAAGEWQSDSADFAALYDRCFSHLATEFHRHDGSLGRREFFADAFAAIASGQRPALVDMLSGNTRTALDVMLYFNVRYGI